MGMVYGHSQAQVKATAIDKDRRMKMVEACSEVLTAYEKEEEKDAGPATRLVDLVDVDSL